MVFCSSSLNGLKQYTSCFLKDSLSCIWKCPPLPNARIILVSHQHHPQLYPVVIPTELLILLLSSPVESSYSWIQIKPIFQYQIQILPSPTKAFPEDFLASCPCTYWYFSFPKCFGISCISQFMYYLHHLLLLYLNITEDGDYNEIKRLLLLGRKAMTDLDSTLKSRDIILLTKICKVIVFPVVSYGCKSWTIKNAEYWRIGAFELWCWRRWLRVPWTARRLKKSILKEISPE